MVLCTCDNKSSSFWFKLYVTYAQRALMKVCSRIINCLNHLAIFLLWEPLTFCFCYVHFIHFSIRLHFKQQTSKTCSKDITSEGMLKWGMCSQKANCTWIHDHEVIANSSNAFLITKTSRSDVWGKWSWI